MQVQNLRNRLRVNMVCEWAWVSIPGERELPKSLIGALAWSSDHTHTGKRAHVLLFTMALKQKQTKVDVQ